MEFTKDEINALSLLLAIGYQLDTERNPDIKLFCDNRGLSDDDFETIVSRLMSKFMLIRQNPTITYELSIVDNA